MHILEILWQYHRVIWYHWMVELHFKSRYKFKNLPMFHKLPSGTNHPSISRQLSPMMKKTFAQSAYIFFSKYQKRKWFLLLIRIWVRGRGEMGRAAGAELASLKQVCQRPDWLMNFLNATPPSTSPDPNHRRQCHSFVSSRGRLPHTILFGYWHLFRAEWLAPVRPIGFYGDWLSVVVSTRNHWNQCSLFPWRKRFLKMFFWIRSQGRGT